MKLMNPQLDQLQKDELYHLNLSSTDDAIQEFANVKHVWLCGTASRAKTLAETFQKQHPEYTVKEFGNPNRYTMYVAGPVLVASHGIGMSSLSVLLNELFKLMCYAGVENPKFFRFGTCGGLDVEPGTLVVSKNTLSAYLTSEITWARMGQVVSWPCALSEELQRQVMQVAPVDVPIVDGYTVGANSFYEEQCRLDGFFDPEIQESTQKAFLKKLREEGVVNFEMESPLFAAYTHKAGVQAAVVCVTLVNRFNTDQVELTQETYYNYIDRLTQLAMNLIEDDLKKG